MLTSLVALLAVGLQNPPPAFSLRYTPLLNDAAKYQTTVTMVKDGVTTTVDSITQHMVVNVDGDGTYTLRSTTASSIMRSEGHEFKNPDPTTVEIVFGPDGRPLRFLAPTASAIALRVSSMNRFVAPDHKVQAGDSYVIDRTGDDSAGLPSSTATFKFVKTEDKGIRQVAHVSVEYAETSGNHPAKATGEWQIDTYTGVPVSLDLSISSFETALGSVTAYHLQKIDPQPTS